MIRGPMALSRRQRVAANAVELLWAGLQRRERSWVPVGGLVRIGTEHLLGEKLPRTARAFGSLRFVSAGLIDWVLPSSVAARLVQRRLASDPQQTLTVLERLHAVVKATRALHLTDWELNLASAELRSLTLDGTLSELFRRANFSRSTLVDVRFFGLLAGANFDRSTMRGVSFIGSSLYWASFRGAKLEDVVIANGQAMGCRFDGAGISHCTISDIDLDGSSFVHTQLREVLFERCDLEGVDVEGATWENVDLIECRNVDPALADFARDNVTAAGKDGGSGLSPRTTLGATPRSLAGPDAASDGPAGVKVRYAQAPSVFRPPLGYRLQTLARSLHVWIALGSDYRSTQKRLARDPDPAYRAVLPRSRLLGALRILLGTERPSDDHRLSAIVYPLLAKAFRERYPDLKDAALPELVLVDGTYPVANFVDLGEQKYIVLSAGMEVTTIRLARYCIAWVLPSAVSYMDRWPSGEEPEAIRGALVEGLKQFADSKGDIGGLGRIQITGLRDQQATYLTMTFLAFALGHELAHFLQAEDSGGLDDFPYDPETQADVVAAWVLKSEHELDGDAMVGEEIGKMTADEVRAAFRSMVRFRKDLRLQLRDVPDGALDLRGEELVSALSRFADCDWHAAAVTAFILIVGGSGAHHGAKDLDAHISTVIRGAFGDDTAAALMNELAAEGSVLQMLRSVFCAEQAAA
ncbi:MAG TPA: pentapeptide repeat-containing protein [Solirubrobacterales bacterium]|jgi:uncharacterized protein YjbI with pentapeptide repeats|nr:pentapeptide repeat-containing protein [Solirubrobacterales bacterium]